MLNNKLKFIVWGRSFELGVNFDCFPDENVLQTQNEALKKFIESSCVDEAENAVKEYCLKENGNDIKEKDIENIFRYIIPKSVYVVRNEEKRMVALMCDYKYDIEHGLAIVFENECLQSVGPQDIIL